MRRIHRPRATADAAEPACPVRRCGRPCNIAALELFHVGRRNRAKHAERLVAHGGFGINAHHAHQGPVLAPIAGIPRKVSAHHDPTWPAACRFDQLVRGLRLEWRQPETPAPLVQQTTKLHRRCQWHAHGHRAIAPRSHPVALSLIVDVNCRQHSRDLAVKSPQEGHHCAAVAVEVIEQQYTRPAIRGIPQPKAGGATADLTRIHPWVGTLQGLSDVIESRRGNRVCAGDSGGS